MFSLASSLSLLCLRRSLLYLFFYWNRFLLHFRYIPSHTAHTSFTVLCFAALATCVYIFRHRWTMNWNYNINIFRIHGKLFIGIVRFLSTLFRRLVRVAEFQWNRKRADWKKAKKVLIWFLYFCFIVCSFCCVRMVFIPSTPRMWSSIFIY